MSLVSNIVEWARGRSENLRARIVPAAIIMLLMMVLAVGFLTDSVSAATDDNEGLNVGGDPILIYILVVIAVGCLVLWKITEENLLLYAFLGCLIGAVVIFYVH